MNFKLVKLTDCYGATHYAKADDLVTAIHMVPLYSKNGTPINELPGFKKGSAHMLAVGNIEEMEAVN